MATDQLIIRKAYTPRERHQINFPDQGRTKQSFRDECDINNIMAKYQKSGLLDFVNNHQAQYGDATGVEFQAAMELVVRGQELFDALPSSVRKRFDNNPEEFLEFVNDPASEAEAIKLGLISEPVDDDKKPIVRQRRRKDSGEPKASPTDGEGGKT